MGQKSPLIRSSPIESKFPRRYKGREIRHDSELCAQEKTGFPRHFISKNIFTLGQHRGPRSQSTYRFDPMSNAHDKLSFLSHLIHEFHGRLPTVHAVRKQTSSCV